MTTFSSPTTRGITRSGSPGVGDAVGVGVGVDVGVGVRVGVGDGCWPSGVGDGGGAMMGTFEQLPYSVVN